ncbi:MAG: 1-acyl-sn-glycerol-3-phosphate acyltransferase, partial [Myxococcaceae bacterium]
MAMETHKGLLARLLNGRAGEYGRDPRAFDGEAVSRTLRFLAPLFGPRRYFRLDARGLGEVPEPPVLVVSNHSGGTSIPDVWGLLVSWYRHFGVRRPVHPMAHELLLSTATPGTFFSRVGVLRGDPELALKALGDFGHDVLVMPGGDLDTWRPFRDRYRVQFGQRLGYARLALKAGVPVVPVAHAGAHHTLIVLTDGQAIARALRLPRLARAGIFPIHLALPWGLTVGPWPHLPIPVTLRYRVGKPILPARGLRGGEPARDEVLALNSKIHT